VTLEDYAEDPERKVTKTEPRENSKGDDFLVKGLSSEAVRILRRPKEGVIWKQLKSVFDKGCQKKNNQVQDMHPLSISTATRNRNSVLYLENPGS